MFHDYSGPVGIEPFFAPRPKALLKGYNQACLCLGICVWFVALNLLSARGEICRASGMMQKQIQTISYRISFVASWVVVFFKCENEFCTKCQLAPQSS